MNVFAEQAKYLDDAQLATKLKDNTFFNPNWSANEINRYAEIAYNDLLHQGKTGSLEYFINGEKLTVYINADGSFGTVYGHYTYTVDQIRNMVP